MSEVHTTISACVGGLPFKGVDGLIVDSETRAAVRTWLSRMGWSTQDYISLDTDTLRTVYTSYTSYVIRCPSGAVARTEEEGQRHATSDYAPRNARLLAALARRNGGTAGVASPLVTDAVDLNNTVAAADGAVPAILPALPGLPVYDPAVLAKIDALGTILGVDAIASTLHRLAEEAIGAAGAYKAALDDAARAPSIVSAPVACAGYIPPAWARTLRQWVALGRVVALVGPAGNGKTTAARKEIEAMGYTVYEVDCTEDTTAGDVIGRRTLEARDGASVAVYQYGPAAKALQDEKGALLLNEYDALDPRVGLSFQSLFEVAADGRRRVTLPESGEQMYATGDCPIVLTLNTLGNGASRAYVGRNALDGANKDRVEIIVTGYEADGERLIAHGAHKVTAGYLAGWASAMRDRIERNGSRVTVSLRRLLSAAALIDKANATREDALEMAFFGRLDTSEAAALR